MRKQKRRLGEKKKSFILHRLPDQHHPQQDLLSGNQSSSRCSEVDRCLVGKAGGSRGSEPFDQ